MKPQKMQPRNPFLVYGYANPRYFCDREAETQQMLSALENERNLTVRDLRLDTGAAVRRFVEAGLVVSDAHLYEDTLEDYFKRITGGEGIA